MSEPGLKRCSGVPDGSGTGAATPVLQARGLCYHESGHCLIDHVDLAIRAGRLTVVAGANGAGKSLLLRLLHGLLRPTSGTILFRGQPLDRTARRSQAMVFQRPVMLRRSVRENLRFALRVQGTGRQERARRVNDALDRLRLAPIAHRPARLLSGGEQQRLAVARALVRRPDILFLDEPTANLDPASIDAIEALIREARRSRITIILVSHDVGQARRLGDDMVFLHAGRVVEKGVLPECLDRPCSEAMAAWLDGRLYLDQSPGVARGIGERC